MFPGYKIILASKSPRRQLLLKELGCSFEVRTREVEEVFPPHLKREQVALYLAELKAKAFDEELGPGTVVITADTIVCVDDLIVGKPADYNDAVRILRLLSGRRHEVITGVCLHNGSTLKSFHVCTDVYFKKLTDEEIGYYLENYRPYDKAGAYGIQEWIGLIGIERINGSYFNVMGLPVKELYEELLRFDQKP
jgi:septum formation protein